MDNILSVIYFILILSVIVVVHELGHLIAAKKFNVYCKEFSIGMGPVIWQKQKKETAWSIRLLPIGGFVAMAGEDGEDDDIPYERTLNGIKTWKQIIIMAAGAFMNIILAWIIFIGITAYQGAISVPAEPIIQNVASGLAAEKAGFQVGDKIIHIKNSKAELTPKTSDDIVSFIQYYPLDSTFTVLRDGKTLTLTMTPTYDEEHQIHILGVQYVSDGIKEISFLEAIPYGTQKMLSSITMIFDALSKLIKGIGLNTLSGPVGIYQATAQITQTNLISVFAFVALLSVNVGVMNLIPIPILDGGRIFIILIESIIGRKLNEKIQTLIMMAGLILIVGLMLFATWNDIVRLL